MAINSIETFQSLGLATSADKVDSKKQELGQEQFLKLLTTQLTHNNFHNDSINGYPHAQ